MGRPKMSALSCSICNILFKRKTFLEEHMKIHSNSKPLRKHLKSYCYVCRKSFEPNEYKLHIQTEHQFDSPKVNKNNADDLLSCENGFVLLSKKKIKTEHSTPDEKLSAIEKGKSLVVSITDIKIEPTDLVGEESDLEEHQKVTSKTSIKKHALPSKIPKLKCSICGILCKGQKGLKIHMCSHRRSQTHSHSGGSQSENENDDYSLFQSPKRIRTAASFNNPNVQFSLSNTGAGNYAQITPSNSILNASQFQNCSNLVSSGNQSFLNQSNLPFDSIPKFDCDSEKYVKWLKKFVSKCKMHNYPLNQELCKKISHVADEISTALGNPTSALKQKANHFYFMSTYNMLSEIMLNHLQYTLCGIKK